jgi:hypothetical protein
MKWAGKRATLKTHYRALVRRCRSKDPDGNEFSGTTAKDFQNTLKYASQKIFTIEFLQQPGIKRLEKELKDGKAIALLHLNPDGTSHYTLLIESTEKDFVAVNAFKDGRAVSIVSRKIMKFWTKKSNYMPMAWVLTRQQ